jgi:hypothetical protein
MTDRIESPISFAVTYLQMVFEDLDLSSGSGFFWKHAGHAFLITNWHNASGRNPDTDKPLSPTAAIPDAIKFTVFQKETRADEPDSEYSTLTPAALSIPLYNQTGGKPLWLEHPTHGRAVDVVAVPLRGLSESQFLINYANEIVPNLDQEARAAQDAFVVGFPLGMIAGVPIPVWKRATIATEPFVDIQNLPKLLVDTATRSGMSGSLVLAKHFILGPYTTNGVKNDNLIAVKDSILGVYSGRLGADQVQAQLGIVWKRRVIDEILSGWGGGP